MLPAVRMGVRILHLNYLLVDTESNIIISVVIIRNIGRLGDGYLEILVGGEGVDVGEGFPGS